MTTQETIAELLRKSKRRRVPLRRTFLQKGTQNTPKKGVLASLVRRHDLRGLDLYLLVMGAATADPYEARYDARMWARAISVEGESAAATVSRTWRRLAELKLISRGRKGRKANVRLLNEDGSGAAYTPPGLARGDVYLQIPLAYWLDGWHAKLSLSAKAMLLICLTLGTDFPLPSERVKDWYGISAETAESGLRELRDNSLLRRVVDWKRTPLTADGFTKFYRYNLLPPYRRKRPATKAA